MPRLGDSCFDIVAILPVLHDKPMYVGFGFYLQLALHVATRFVRHHVIAVGVLPIVGFTTAVVDASRETFDVGEFDVSPNHLVYVLRTAFWIEDTRPDRNCRVCRN